MRLRHLVKRLLPTLLAPLLAIGPWAYPGGIPVVTAHYAVDDLANPLTPAHSAVQMATAPSDQAEASDAVQALAGEATDFPSNPTPLMIVRARPGGPQVRTQPSSAAPLLSGLYYDTYLPVFGQQTDASGGLWYAVRLWGVLPGWIRASQTETGDPPPPPPRASPPPSSVSGPHGPSAVYPLRSSGVVRDWFNLRASPGITGAWRATLAPGTPVRVAAWQTDVAGSAWYQVSGNGQTGWIYGAGVDLATGKPNRTGPDGEPTFAAIEGRGLWLPIPLLAMATPEAIVGAAKELGVTHIYLEVGDSGRFYGQKQLDRLLPIAHRAGIKVIGWVLTYLYDLPKDVSTCTTIADYQTPGGDRLDGLAPDVEFNMDPDDVTTFAEVVRTALGPNRLIVGVIYPAGSWIGQRHSIAPTLSASFNALAPMDYWHDTKRAFSSDEVSQFIRHTVEDIHKIVGDPRFPVEPIGQTYDSFSRNGAGPNNPTGAEITAALQSAKDSGAVGVSLFQWGTMTPAEWEALKAFHWR